MLIYLTIATIIYKLTSKNCNINCGNKVPMALNTPEFIPYAIIWIQKPLFIKRSFKDIKNIRVSNFSLDSRNLACARLGGNAGCFENTISKYKN